MPINRAETPGWARYSSPSVADYSNPITKSPPPLPRPSPLTSARSSNSHHGGLLAQPPIFTPRSASSGTSSGSSLHSTSLVYDTAKSRVATHFTPIHRNNNRSLHRIAAGGGNNGGYDPVAANIPQHHHSHLLDARGGFSGGGAIAGIRPQYNSSVNNSYPDYEYTTPGEASPYSVSSELYKHVLPQYYTYGTEANKSVLV